MERPVLEQEAELVIIDGSGTPDQTNGFQCVDVRLKAEQIMTMSNVPRTHRGAKIGLLVGSVSSAFAVMAGLLMITNLSLMPAPPGRLFARLDWGLSGHQWAAIGLLVFVVGLTGASLSIIGLLRSQRRLVAVLGVVSNMLPTAIFLSLFASGAMWFSNTREYSIVPATLTTAQKQRQTKLLLSQRPVTSLVGQTSADHRELLSLADERLCETNGNETIYLFAIPSAGRVDIHIEGGTITDVIINSGTPISGGLSGSANESRANTSGESVEVEQRQ